MRVVVYVEKQNGDTDVIHSILGIHKAVCKNKDFRKYTKNTGMWHIFVLVFEGRSDCATACDVTLTERTRVLAAGVALGRRSRRVGSRRCSLLSDFSRIRLALRSVQLEHELRVRCSGARLRVSCTGYFYY